MKGLMKRAAAAAAAMALSVGALPFDAFAFGGVTEANTPQLKTDTVLKWAQQISAGWSNSPSMPCISGDEVIYVASNKLQALDRETGQKLDKSAELCASYNSFGVVAPLAADGKIFVAMGGGTIEAFDAETFAPLWVYHDDMGGQALTEMVYKDGYIYTGFWNGETADANYVCLPTEDKDTARSDEEQTAAWKYASPGGYYWAGAYVTDDLVIFGTDNGQSDGSSKGSKLVAVKKNESIEAGEAVVSSQVGDLFGDLRSGITYDESTGYYFATSKGNLLIRFQVTDGQIRNVHSLVIPGASTSTPVSANGRVYVGVCGKSQFGEYSGHQIAVIDAEKFEMVYGVQTNGYCQSSALVSSRDGENYVYFTANYNPGKVYVLHDAPGMTAPDKTEKVTLKDGSVIDACPTLFTPVGSHAQYCLGSIMTDDEGTLYFRNDSGNIFALGSRLDEVQVSGKTLYKEGDSLDNYTVTAIYANGAEKDITATATAGEGNAQGELSAGKGEVVFGYDGMEYGDTESETGHEYDAVYGELEYTVLTADEYDALYNTIDAINAIGSVTLDSKEAIDKARTLYSSLSEDAKPFVENYSVLTDAESAYQQLIDQQGKAPGKVTIQKKFSCTADTVRINWDKTDGADGYSVYFMNKQTKKFDKTADVSADTLTYRMSKLDSATTYKFKVRAYKLIDGEKVYGEYSDEKAVITRPGSAVNISANFTCTQDAVRINWEKVKNVSGYTVYMMNNSTKKYEEIANVNSDTFTYRKAKLTPGTVYKFRIRAYKSLAGEKVYGNYSNFKKVVTKPSPAAEISSSFSYTTESVRINWNKVDGADGYSVYFLNKKTKKYTRLADVSAKTLSYRKVNLTPSTAYKFKVRAYKLLDGKKYYGGYSAAKTVATRPKVTSIVVGKCAAEKNRIKITFKQLSKASGYTVQRYSEEPGKWVNVKTIGGNKKNSVYASGLKADTQYKFRVRAYKTVGNTKVYGEWSKVKKLRTAK